MSREQQSRAQRAVTLTLLLFQGTVLVLALLTVFAGLAAQPKAPKLPPLPKLPATIHLVTGP